MNTSPTSLHRCYPARAPRGAAYIIALLVTTVLATMTLVFAREMRVQTDAAANRVSQTQARWIALGALEAVRGDLAQVIATGEAPHLYLVNPSGSAMGDGLFWIIRPHPDDDTKTGFGIQGEGGKINLDAFAGIDFLELNNVDENLAASIIDWQDRNPRITPGGAESAYYLSRDTPYEIKDRDLETVGELMYVKGMTKDILFGEDTNRNYRLDPNEDDGNANPPNDNGDGKLDRGLIDLVTVYSRDPGLNDVGEQKLTIDTKQSLQEHNALKNYLISQLGEKRGTEIAQASFAFTGTAGQNQTYTSTLQFFTVTKSTDAEFELVHDRIKRLDNENTLEGLIDVYEATETVLATLPGLDPGDARSIINSRPERKYDEPPRNISWVIDVLGEQKAIPAARYMTHRSLQTTVDIVAVSGDGRGFCRLRVVLDCAPVLQGQASLPVIRHVEDLTSYGWPLDEEIRQMLRRGATHEEVLNQTREDGL